MRELPHLVQLHQKYPDQVACITVNLDYSGGEKGPEEFRQQVLKLLEPRDATCINVISSDSDEQVYQQLGLAAVPAVLVYDKTGALRKRFDNEQGEYGDEGFNYEQHIVPLVERLLAE